MVKKTNTKVLNYLLSVAFILFLVTLLMLFLLMGRYVLSETAPVGSHVQVTKSLLEEVSEVQKAATQNTNETDSTSFIREIDVDEVPTLNGLGAEVTDISYSNVNENKSILTVFIDHEIEKLDNVFYILIKDFTELDKGDLVFYDFTTPKRATFITLENGEVLLEGLDGEIVKVEQDEVLGRALFIE